MADEAAAVPTPEEELPPEEQEEKQASTVKPKPKGPSARFGQLLMLGNDNWTVRDADKDGVTVMRRIGNLLEERRLSAEEFEKAKSRPLPKQMSAKGSAFASRGLSAGGTVGLPESLGGIARISGYDAATGEVQVDVPGRGPTWVSKNTIQDLILPEGDREKGLETFAEATGQESPAKLEAREKKQAADRKKKQTAAAVAEAPTAMPAPAVPPPAQVPAAPAERPPEPEEEAPPEEVEIETETPVPEKTVPTPAAPATKPATTRPVVAVSRTIPVGGPVPSVAKTPARRSAAPSVRVSRTVSVGGAAPSAGTAIGAAGVSASVAGAAPAAAVPAAVSGSVQIPQPSIRETRAQMSADMKAVEVQVPSEAPAAASGVQDQQQLYVRAANALQVIGARVATQRAAIQDMQGQANTLRNEIANLNASQATAAQPSAQGAGPYRTPAAADVSGRIQTASQQLGDLNNRVALARFNLQADEARAQQLQIGTNLMRNAAPLVSSGRMPKFMAALVERSIPTDIPAPSPARAAALAATLTGEAPELAVPAPGSAAVAAPIVAAPRSFAAAPPSDFDRGQAPAAGAARDGGIAARQVLQKRGLTLPAATVVAYSAAQQADRAGGGYQEGLGSPDARTAAFGSEGATAGRPVIDTIPQSYSADRDITEAEQAEDVFAAGAGGPSSEFAKKQLEAQRTQEQFLPGTTPSVEGPAFEKEAERKQGIRLRPEEGAEGAPPEPEALRAAAFEAAKQRARLGALSAISTEEDEKAGAASALKAVKQVESVRRNVSRMFDLFNAALAVATVETVLGAIWEIFVLLANMNGRVLTLMFFRDPKSLVRRLLPSAQFPYEVAAIVAVDFALVAIVFLGFCILVAPFVIFAVLATLGIGAFAIVAVGS
ncbi:hypothetical protein M0Q28_01100 [Patescibacteria group bacterium]|jgi:hypothetical protein|nr:hypothetical protein [Patescibacteria group bacterium]